MEDLLPDGWDKVTLSHGFIFSRPSAVCTVYQELLQTMISVASMHQTKRGCFGALLHGVVVFLDRLTHPRTSQFGTSRG